MKTASFSRVVLLLSSLFVCSTQAYASDEEEYYAHGHEIHDKYCTKCHSDQVYIRENHFVKSLNALKQQVNRCKDGNNIPWFDEDTESVVQFLNKKYYKF